MKEHRIKNGQWSLFDDALNPIKLPPPPLIPPEGFDEWKKRALNHLKWQKIL